MERRSTKTTKIACQVSLSKDGVPEGPKEVQYDYQVKGFRRRRWRTEAVCV
jgi:hypothetical protein